MAFSEALSKHKIFSRLYVNLVRAGRPRAAWTSSWTGWRAFWRRSWS